MNEGSLSDIIGNRLEPIKSIETVDKPIINEVLLDIASISNIKELSFDFIIKDSKGYILFKFRDASGSNCKGAYNVALSDLESSIIKLVDKIEKGECAIELLNKALKKRQYEHGEPLSVSYKWNNTKQCSISDWDYNSIKIKLSDLSLDTLISIISKDDGKDKVEELVKELQWNGNIIQFIKDFNKFDLHEKLGVTFGSFDTEKIISENMLGTSEVLDIIRKQSNISGTQRFKSVFIVKELGKFAVILLWSVDYNKKVINTSIMGDKALDIENSRFISDHNLFSRIENRTNISKEIIDSVFKNIS